MASKKPIQTVQNALDQGLSRRQYFGVMAALGASTTAGCLGEDGDDDDDVIDDGDDDDTDEDDRYGGILENRIRDSLDSLDSHVAASGDVWAALSDHVTEKPMHMLHDGSVEPRLISNVEFEDDGQRIIADVQEGVMFHPPVSREMTGDDILINWFRVLDPEEFGGDAGDYDEFPGQTGGRQDNLNFFDNVYLEDDYTIVMETETPNAFVEWNMADRGQDIMAPENLREEEYDPETHPIGTGPFKFVEWVPEEHVHLEKFDDYWRSDADGNQLPYVDELWHLQIPDDTVYVNELLNEEIDIISEAPYPLLDELEAADNVTVTAPEAVFERMHFNCNCTDYQEENRAEGFPTMDWNVRRALMEARDQQDYLALAVDGYGVAEQTMYPSAHQFGIEYNAVEPGAHPEAAQEYLEENWDTPVEIIVHSDAENPQAEASAEIAIEHLEVAGFDPELDLSESALYSERLSTNEWDVNVQYGSIGPTPETMRGDRVFQRSTPEDQRSYHPGNEETGMGDVYDEYDVDAEAVISLMEEGAQIFDEDEQMEVYEEAWQRLADDGNYIMCYHREYVRAHGNWVNQYNAYPDTFHSNFFENWLDETHR